MKKGFTLIELLVVISIIGILASFFVSTYSNAQVRARDKTRKKHMEQIQNALELFRQRYGQYPDFFGPAQATGNFGIPPGGIPYLNEFLHPRPYDPSRGTSCPNYMYMYTADRKAYSMFAMLENSNDQDAVAIKTPPVENIGGNGGCRKNPGDSGPHDENCRRFKVAKPNGGGVTTCQGHEYNYWVNSPN